MDASECNLPIAIRAYSEPLNAPDPKSSRRKPARPSPHTIVFDCETTTDWSQALRFGTYQHRYGHELREAGIFYDPALTPEEVSVLARYCARKGLTLRSRETFIHEIFYKYAYELRGTIVGFNLPFDLARIAIHAGIAKLDMYGGHSLKLSFDKRRPHVQVKHVSRRFSLLRFAAPFRQTASRSERNRGEKQPIRRGFFVDVATLASALLAKSFTLVLLAKELKVASPKLEADQHGGTLTEEYLDYAVRDAQTTWECYAELVRRYERLGLSAPVHRIYSEASLGKAYLDEMRVRPWREVQPSIPPRLLGTVMSAYFGGRSEVRIRREIREVVHCDFLSMYPTVCTLQGLWQFVIARGMRWHDDTDGVRTFLNGVSLCDLQRADTWKRLITLVQVEAAADVFPVRAR